MLENEKFKVGVPAKAFISLNRDAEQFEIYRDNGTEINTNGFLSLLIVGYYKKYKQERSEKISRIREIVGPGVRLPKKPDEIAERIMEEIILPEVPKRKGKNPERFSLTPTRETDHIISEIKGFGGSYTDYLCRMFMSYCEKPVHERERIIFCENVAFLEEACRKKREITFFTGSNPRHFHRVIPYELAVGAGEMNNYLLCQEYIPDRQRNEAISYRLCRIMNPDYSDNPGVLEEGVARHLEMMKKRGPQYAINEENVICVRFTPEGQDSYRKIYFARPAADRIEMQEDGSALYWFSDTPDLVFRFVIRFKAGEAVAVSPPEFRERVYRHFRESAASYEKT